MFGKSDHYDLTEHSMHSPLDTIIAVLFYLCVLGGEKGDFYRACLVLLLTTSTVKMFPNCKYMLVSVFLFLAVCIPLRTTAF
mmetsp:Transcript_7554/g.16315  ORF Transcript_7554/g.16315 Transcript_7554/m.16315 type:complete len:82 (-) Transcript_7554:494-739(-)